MFPTPPWPPISPPWCYLAIQRVITPPPAGLFVGPPIPFDFSSPLLFVVSLLFVPGFPSHAPARVFLPSDLVNPTWVPWRTPVFCLSCFCSKRHDGSVFFVFRPPLLSVILRLPCFICPFPFRLLRRTPFWHQHWFLPSAVLRLKSMTIFLVSCSNFSHSLPGGRDVSVLGLFFFQLIRVAT